MQDAHTVLIDAIEGLPSLAEDGVKEDPEARSGHKYKVWNLRSELLRNAMRSVFRPEHYDDFGHRAYALSCSWFGQLVTMAFETKKKYPSQHIIHRVADPDPFFTVLGELDSQLGVYMTMTCKCRCSSVKAQTTAEFAKVVHTCSVATFAWNTCGHKVLPTQFGRMALSSLSGYFQVESVEYSGSECIVSCLVLSRILR